MVVLGCGSFHLGDQPLRGTQKRAYIENNQAFHQYERIGAFLKFSVYFIKFPDFTLIYLT